jgi:molybdopterin-guanine dinucleotide biosynthesis protein A
VGVALAGGSSQRLGDDKSRILHPRGGTLLDWTVRRLEAACDEVLVASRGRHAHPASIDDGPGAGPAAGILGAAGARPGRSLLVLACDLPEVPSSLLAYLAERGRHGAVCDWIVPAHPRIEPLCALYAPPALDTLTRRVANGRYSLHGLLDEPALSVCRLGAEELAPFGPSATLFRNLNTAEDLTRWREESAAAIQGEEPGASSPPGDPSSAHRRRRKSKR